MHDSRYQHEDNTFLNLHSSHPHTFESTVMQRPQKTCKHIPMADHLAMETQDYSRVPGGSKVKYFDPRFYISPFCCYSTPIIIGTKNNDPSKLTNLQDYSRVPGGSKVKYFGPRFYISPFCCYSTPIIIGTKNNDPSKLTNLHIYNCDWRLGYGATLIVLGYQEDMSCTILGPAL